MIWILFWASVLLLVLQWFFSGGGRSPLWGSATLGAIFGVIIGIFVGNIGMGLVYGLVIGTGFGVISNILEWLVGYLHRRRQKEKEVNDS